MADFETPESPGPLENPKEVPDVDLSESDSSEDLEAPVPEPAESVANVKLTKRTKSRPNVNQEVTSISRNQKAVSRAQLKVKIPPPPLEIPPPPAEKPKPPPPPAEKPPRPKVKPPYMELVPRRP
jgi:hypothetical protein